MLIFLEGYTKRKGILFKRFAIFELKIVYDFSRF